MFYEDDRVRAAAERCARLESWLQLETDPAEREKIGKALADAKDTFKDERERAAKEKAEREAAAKAEGGKDKMFGDGNVTDFFKKLDDLAAEKKAAEAVKEIGSKDQDAKPDATAEAAVDDEAAAKELQLVRQLEPPVEITELPEYKALYEEALAKYAAEAEAAAEISAGGGDGDGGSTKEDFENVPELAPGQEIEGTVAAVIERDDRLIYIVRNEEGLMAALDDKDGQCAHLERGDEVCASRDQDGNYEVHQDNDYGL